MAVEMRPALLLALVALAGCATPVGVGPHLGSPLAAGVEDHQATVEPATRQANELSIAVNPLDPLNIIATGKDYTPDEAGECVWAGLYASKDGGRTWKDQNVPGSPWRHAKDPTTPVTPFTKFWCATDPVVQFGPDGTAYWAVMPYQCDALSGSKTGRGTLKDGGLNDWLYTCSAMYVLVSTDGGLTWPVEKAREVSTGPFIANDKEWLAVAPDGQKLLLCWDYAGDDGGFVREPTEVPRLPSQPPKPDVNSSVVCSLSKDKGNAWSKPAVATRVGGVPMIDLDGTGRAWMATTDDARGEIYVTSSADGVKWEKPVPVARYTMPTATNEYKWPVLNGSAFRIVSYGALAADRTSGRLYVTYFDHAAGNGDVFVVSSADGKQWSAPVKVNDDAGTSDQFLPAISVGPDGTVDVSWQDRRDDPANHLFHTYYAYSLDGGATFSPNQRVSAKASDEKWSHHQNGMIFLGDYRDMRSTRGQTTMVWVDTRNQKADVFVATVPRPSAS